MTFKDVAIEFSKVQLDSEQKGLHWDMMIENYRNLISLIKKSFPFEMSLSLFDC